MRGLIYAAIASVAMVAPLSSFAGDASGLDPVAMEQCLSDAGTDGARLDCAGAGQAACLAYVEEKHPDVDPVDRQLGCIDAEWQWWETKLTDSYDQLKDIEESRGADRAEALTEMERHWIAFRDARCAYDKLTNGHGTGGAVAEPLCKLNETARQVILLEAYRRDRGE